MTSIENDGRYKRTWGTSSDNTSVQGKEGGVVSSQPNAVRNGQAVSGGSAGASGPYVKRWEQNTLRMMDIDPVSDLANRK